MEVHTQYTVHTTRNLRTRITYNHKQEHTHTYGVKSLGVVGLRWTKNLTLQR